MMGWLSRSSSAPQGVGGQGGFLIDRKKVEPDAAFAVLQDHWQQAQSIMNDSQEVMTPEIAYTVLSHLNQMISFLRLTRPDDPEGKCKQFWIRNKCFFSILNWLSNLQTQGIQLEQEAETRLVATLEGLCELVVFDGDILGASSTPKDKDKDVDGEDKSSISDGACSLSSLLLEYSLKANPHLGEPARNSFIALIKLTSKFPGLENSFSKESGLGLTNVVISGLSACFAQLSTFAYAKREDLEGFVTQLRFIDDITHAAPPKISLTIADCFSNAFLHAVILPSLTQDEGNRSLHSQDDKFMTSLNEEIAIVTSYLKLVCEELSHPLLVKSLIVFVKESLLVLLLKRISSRNISICVSSLSLLNTLLCYYTEDLWYTLLLQYLMSQSHLMVSQRSVQMPQIDFTDASLRFISLIPTTVSEVVGPESISWHYTHYLQNELNRLNVFIPPPAPPTYRQVSNNENESTKTKATNPVFIHWKYKYDGTDKLSESEGPQESESKSKHVILEDASLECAPMNKLIDPLTLASMDEDETKTNGPGPVEESPERQKFTTISLHNVDEAVHNSLILGTVDEEYDNPSIRAQSDGYGSLESNPDVSSTSFSFLGVGNNSIADVSSSSASLGPFLNVIFTHLKNLSRLDPELVLTVTEVVSTLASSRIPLVTSLFLDTNLTLQPSFVSFSMLLNRIRVEFEKSLNNSPYVVSDLWTSLNRQMTPEPNMSTSTSMNFISSLSQSFGSEGDNSFTDNLKKKISNSTTLAPFLTSVFQRKSSLGNSDVSSTSSPNQSSSRNRQASSSSPFTPVATSSPRGASSGDQMSPEVLKVLSLKAIYFTHWLLELAAIAQQLCWKNMEEF